MVYSVCYDVGSRVYGLILNRDDAKYRRGNFPGYAIIKGSSKDKMTPALLRVWVPYM